MKTCTMAAVTIAKLMTTRYCQARSSSLFSPWRHGVLNRSLENCSCDAQTSAVGSIHYALSLVLLVTLHTLASFPPFQVGIFFKFMNTAIGVQCNDADAMLEDFFFMPSRSRVLLV